MVVPAVAQPGICLNRTPAPPGSVPNDGTHTIRFDWTVTFGAGITCNSNYTLEILRPSTVTPNDLCTATVIATLTGPCTDTFKTWTVPANLACGCYYGRLTFKTNWCGGGTTSTVEDQATVGFLVTGAATLQLCKFLDVNGNGIQDLPGDTPLADWTFTISGPTLSQPIVVTTQANLNGCTGFIMLPVNCTSSTTFSITETPPGNAKGWRRTTQGGGAPGTPFQITLSPGQQLSVPVGNWQPVCITGFKLLDQAPWPWTGPDAVNNPAGATPGPTCPQPAIGCSSPFQTIPGVAQQGIGGAKVRLYKDDNGDCIVTEADFLLEATTSTVGNPTGFFSFSPVQFRENFVIIQDIPAPQAPPCQPPLLPGLDPWLGNFIGTVATSPWSPGRATCDFIRDFLVTNRLCLTIPTPTKDFNQSPNDVCQEYGCNYFWDRQPSRIFGQFCPEVTQQIPQPQLTITVTKDGIPYATTSADPGLSFLVPSIPEGPVVPGAQQGLRPGTYTLALPQVPSDECRWQITQYCVDEQNQSGQTTLLPAGVNLVSIPITNGQDVRIDVCLICAPPTERRCFLPVTFTRQGWADFCDPTSTIIPGGMVYNKFPKAFATFNFYGNGVMNQMIIGKRNTITWTGTTSCLNRLCLFLPKSGACGKLTHNYDCPWDVTEGGSLASEAAALMMNIAYNDKRLMPRTPGYDLEDFTVAKGLLKGKTVGQVMDIANAVLGGDPPCQYGLTTCDALVDILSNINGNYAFIDYNTFTDNGYLIPDRGLGESTPGHSPKVPWTGPTP